MSKVMCIWCILMALLMGCYGNHSQHTKPSTSGMLEATQEQSALGYVIQEHTGKDGIVYPQLIGGDEQYTKVNQLIEATVDSQLASIIGEDYSAHNITLAYQIPLQVNERIGILFEGVVTQAGAAHPSDIAFAIMISIPEAKLIPRDDILKIDIDFLENFKNQLSVNADPSRFSDEQWAEVAQYILSFSDEDLLRKLKETEYSVIVTDQDEVIVIFPVPHVIGDYIKIMV